MSQAGAQIGSWAFDELKREKQVADVQKANDLWLEASNQFGSLEEDLKKAPDYRTHVDRWQNGWFDVNDDEGEFYRPGVKDIEKETMTKAGNSDVARYLKLKFTQFKISEGERQRTYQHSLFKQQSLAELVTSLERIRENVSTTGNYNEMVEQMGVGTGLIRAQVAAGNLAAQEGAMKIEQFMDQIEEAQIKKDMFRDPLGTAKSIEQGVYLRTDAIKQIGFLKEAINLHDHRERQRIAAIEKNEKRLEKLAEAESEKVTYELTLEIASGKYVMDKMLNYAKEGVLLRKHFDHLRTIDNEMQKRMAEGMTVPDDPDVKREILPDLLSATPRTKAKELTDLWVGRKLSDKTYHWGMDKIVSSQNKAKDDAKSAVRDRHTQAEQELKMLLYVPEDALGRLTGLKQTASVLLSNAFMELSARSAYFDGSEDPMKVVRKIGPPLRQKLLGSAMIDMRMLESTLRWPTPAALEDAYRSGKIGRGEYDSERSKWETIELYKKATGSAAPAPAPDPEKKGILGTIWEQRPWNPNKKESEEEGNDPFNFTK